MKFCTMTVRVPIDDVLPVRAVHNHLRRVLEDRGTETLDLPAKPDGEADEQQPLTDTLPAVGRVHWTAVDVVQALERAPQPVPNGKGKRQPRADVSR